MERSRNRTGNYGWIGGRSWEWVGGRGEGDGREGDGYWGGEEIDRI